MVKKSSKIENFDIKSLMDSRNSYKSLIYGVVTVAIIFFIIFLGIRTLSQNQGRIDDSAISIEDESLVEYTVGEGETLWSISEKVYGTGFNWQLIAQENSIKDPNSIEEGSKLRIPQPTTTEGKEVVEGEDDLMVEDEPETEVADEAAVKDKVDVSVKEDSAKANEANAKEYVVVKGDSLWKIAVMQYGDGYKWVEIARANKLVNPDLIHAGNSLAIPR